MSEASNALAAALQLFQSGKLEQAGARYKSILKEDPGNSDALFMLAAVYHESGNVTHAIQHVKQAISANPNAAQYHLTLGDLQHKQGNTADAIISYRTCLSLSTGPSPAYLRLGITLIQLDHYEQAVAVLRDACQRMPRNARAYLGLGVALRGLGNIDEAITQIQTAISIQPGLTEAHSELGDIATSLGKLEDAQQHYRKSVSLMPDHAGLHFILANVLRERQLHDEAISEYERAIRLDPEHSDSYNNQGIVFHSIGKFHKARSCYEKAISVNSGNAQAFNNLANLLKDLGEYENAIDYYNRAIEIDPGYAEAFSNKLLSLNYIQGFGTDAIFEEHTKFSDYFEAPQSSKHRLHATELVSRQRLRIGYVSGDFLAHSVSFFIEPVLENHNRNQVEITCYFNRNREDNVTQTLKEKSDRWRCIAGLSDASVAQQIIDDEINILVDLSGHTALNRLPLFARKPAPVQISWLGYPNTTGLCSMDYRLTDEHADPAGMTEHLHTEKLIRLPDTFLCFRPRPQSPEVAPLPATRNGFVTFGSFNNLAKITTEVIELWSAILRAVPDSRLTLKTKWLNVPSVQDRVIAAFGKHGIGPDRISLLGKTGAVSRILNAMGISTLLLIPSPIAGQRRTLIHCGWAYHL